jgi:ketosteroid isomerase-like protein
MADQEKLQSLSEVDRVLVREWLDIVANNSENPERTMKCMTDDCIWVMEPGGTEYHGSHEIRAFVGIAMSGRTHDKGQHKIQIANWFADKENLCYEYTHVAISTGKLTSGIKGEVKNGVLGYCITCHLRDGKVDRVHEYIDSTSWWLHSLMPITLWNLHRLTMKKLAEPVSS